MSDSSDRSCTESILSGLDGQPLSESQAARLLEVTDPEALALLFQAADAERRRLVGDRVTYVINRNINFTNVCSNACGFCAFRRDRNDGEAFTLSVDEVLSKAAEAVACRATELCLQGGVHPDFGLHTYVGLVRELRAAFPRLHLHAFSPMEVAHAARQSAASIERTLVALRDAGVGSMPGTAAEILDDEVRRRICPGKLTTSEWLCVVTAAHRLGLRSTATIMFGHIETGAHQARHLWLLRELQERTGGFTEFIPLPFVPYKAPMVKTLGINPKTAPVQVLRLLAVSRLFFRQTIPNLQVSWPKVGLSLAERSLSCGVNDLGGTLMEESISRLAGAMHGERVTPEELRAVAIRAGRTPAQRTTLYELVEGERV